MPVALCKRLASLRLVVVCMWVAQRPQCSLGSNGVTRGIVQALSMLECEPASCALGFHASAIQTAAAEAFRQWHWHTQCSEV